MRLGLGEEAAWIERVVIATHPMLDPATLCAREDTVGELQRMLEDAYEDTALKAGCPHCSWGRGTTAGSTATTSIWNWIRSWKDSRSTR